MSCIDQVIALCFVLPSSTTEGQQVDGQTFCPTLYDVR